MEEYKQLTSVTVDKETIREKVRAAVYGYAIGDALGKGTEFMTFAEAAARYPGGLKTYDRIIRDAHRSQWKKNEWTLDTDNVIRTVDSIVETGGIDFRNQAESLKTWYDSAPTDATPIVRRVVAERDYLLLRKEPIYYRCLPKSPGAKKIGFGYNKERFAIACE